jgi:hypothetical protein
LRSRTGLDVRRFFRYLAWREIPPGLDPGGRARVDGEASTFPAGLGPARFG